MKQILKISIILSIFLFIFFKFKFNNYNGFPILMYHSIDYKNSRYSVSPENFKNHLVQLYNAGYRTARLEDIILKKVDPEKEKLVVLRFDDSRLSHFKYIKDLNNNVKIDPNCALQILLEFYSQHPRFGKNALFCVIAQEEFHQPQYTKQKFEFLISNGMEIANHGFSHKNLVFANEEDIDNEFGKAMDYWYKKIGSFAQYIKIIALPYGKPPNSIKAKKRLECFSYANKIYNPLAILYAGVRYNRLCPYPTSSNFNPYEIPCIEVTNNNFDQIIKIIK